MRVTLLLPSPCRSFIDPEQSIKIDIALVSASTNSLREKMLLLPAANLVSALRSSLPDSSRLDQPTKSRDLSNFLKLFEVTPSPLGLSASTSA
jgi:hypothetical protein